MLANSGFAQVPGQIKPFAKDHICKDNPNFINLLHKVKYGNLMTALDKRISQFNTDMPPPEEVPVELLCRDKNGTYTIPYACCWFDEEWRNFETNETVTAIIVGWRPIDERR